MAPTDRTDALLGFFKALADLNRLRIVGLLSQESHTVEDLAASLDLSEGTVSHHLRRLAAIGLVEARAEGYYRHYTLRPEVLQRLAGDLLRTESLPALADDVDLGAFERKVLRTFLDEDGRIKAFPVQAKKLRVLLEHVVKAVEAGRRYPERELNGVLGRFHDDVASLRRSLVEEGLMQREGGGGSYWLAGS